MNQRCLEKENTISSTEWNRRSSFLRDSKGSLSQDFLWDSWCCHCRSQLSIRRNGKIKTSHQSRRFYYRQEWRISRERILPWWLWRLRQTNASSRHIFRSSKSKNFYSCRISIGLGFLKSVDEDVSQSLTSIIAEFVKVMKIVLTMPVSTCTAERSFSCLRRLKTYLRSTMTQEILNHLAILGCPSDLDKVRILYIWFDFIYPAGFNWRSI